MLIHMTLKDKGRLSRHHMLAISSWARHNPDHTLLLYDDADLLAYMRCVVFVVLGGRRLFVVAVGVQVVCKCWGVQAACAATDCGPLHSLRPLMCCCVSISLVSQCVYRLHDTADVELYLSLTTAVERTDLWRYLLICRHGGVYTDADTVCVQPIQVGML